MTSQNYTPNGWADHLKSQRAAQERVTPILKRQTDNANAKEGKS